MKEKRKLNIVGLVLFALFVPGALFADPSAASVLRAIDSEGKTVSLSQEARRIVSLSPACTETLFAIGAGDRVVGDTTYCDYPAAAVGLPKVGGFSASSISVERIVALKPDLVVNSGRIHQSVADALARLGIAVFAYSPGTFAAIARDMASLGVLTGTAEQAKAAGTAMLASIDAVRGAVSALKPEEKVSVFWEVYDDPLMTCGKATFQHAIIEASGGVDIFSDLPGSWPQVSAEEVIKRAPMVIAGADDMGDKLTAAAIAARPGWSSIPAVRNGRIALFPSALVSRASPRVAEGVALMAKALYPRLFP